MVINDSIFNVNVELIFSCDFHEFPLVYIFSATQLNARESNYTELYVVMILNFMHDKFSGPHQRNLNLKTSLAQKWLLPEYRQYQLSSMFFIRFTNQ